MSGARLDEPLRAAPVARRVATSGTLPLAFERITPGVYMARSRGYDVKITTQDVVIALAGGEALASARVRLSFPGATPGVLIPHTPNETVTPFVRARARWRPEQRTFARVRRQAVHPGIDVVFYGSDRQLEYEFVVAPGAQPDAIAMAFDGIEAVSRAADGDLIISTAGRQLTLRRPDAYQDVNGTRIAIAADFAIENQIARVVLGQYDGSRPLVIHPAP